MLHMTHGKIKVMCYTTADVYPDSMQDHLRELVVGLEKGMESSVNLLSIPRVACERGFTYSAISLESGSCSCSSGLRGASEGKDGVKGVMVWAVSICTVEVGEKLSSGTAFSWLSPAVNHDLRYAANYYMK
jgi:hypothetical protein